MKKLNKANEKAEQLVEHLKEQNVNCNLPDEALAVINAFREVIALLLNK